MARGSHIQLVLTSVQGWQQYCGEQFGGKGLLHRQWAGERELMVTLKRDAGDCGATGIAIAGGGGFAAAGSRSLEPAGLGSQGWRSTVGGI